MSLPDYLLDPRTRSTARRTICGTRGHVQHADWMLWTSGQNMNSKGGRYGMASTTDRITL